MEKNFVRPLLTTLMFRDLMGITAVKRENLSREERIMLGFFKKMSKCTISSGFFGFGVVPTLILYGWRAYLFFFLQMQQRFMNCRILHFIAGK